MTSRRGEDDASFESLRNRLGTAFDPQLAKEVFDVGLNRILADEQTSGDLSVGKPIRYELEHLLFSGG